MARYWYEHLRKSTSSSNHIQQLTTTELSNNNNNNNNNNKQSQLPLPLPPNSESRRIKEKAWYSTIRSSSKHQQLNQDVKQQLYNLDETTNSGNHHHSNRTVPALSFLRGKNSKSQIAIIDQTQSIQSTSRNHQKKCSESRIKGSQNTSSIGIQPTSKLSSLPIQRSASTSSSPLSSSLSKIRSSPIIIQPDDSISNYQRYPTSRLATSVISTKSLTNPISSSPKLSPQPHQHRSPLQLSSSPILSPASTCNLNSHSHHSTYQAHQNQNYLSHSHIPPQDVSNQEVELITQSLATRLEELANANSDGLINDEEYRTLRQGLFDQITSGGDQENALKPQKNYSRIQNLSSLDGEPFSSSSMEYQPAEQNLSPPPPPPPTSSLNHHQFLSRRAASSIGDKRHANSLKPKSSRSNRSTSSFLHALFRRQSKSIISPSDCDSDSIRLSNFGSDRLDEAITPTRANSIFSAKSKVFINPSKGSAARSIDPHPNHFNLDAPRPTRARSHLQLQSTPVRVIMNKNNDSLSAPQIRKRPSKTNRTTPNGTSQMIATSSFTGGNSSTPTSNNSNNRAQKQQQQQQQQQKSASGMKREILELEDECKRLLETFEQMERDTIARYRSVPRSGTTRTRLEEIDDLINQRVIPSTKINTIGSKNFSSSGTGESGSVNVIKSKSKRVDGNERGVDVVEGETGPVLILAQLRTAKLLRSRRRRRKKELDESDRLGAQPSGALRSASCSSDNDDDDDEEEGEGEVKMMMMIDSMKKNTLKTRDYKVSIAEVSNPKTTERLSKEEQKAERKGEGEEEEEVLEGSNELQIRNLLESEPELEVRLREEIRLIRLKKEAVRKKYDDRIEYLNAKLRGALIREKERSL